jgi:membrane protein DedA with SNARE-associated domain
MIGLIVWLVGLLCCIWCIKDVWNNKKHLDQVVKIILTVALLAFSWVGLAVYYFILKDRL